ncbi:hypothetical protein K2990_004729 [Escherichia coli]|nr:hypothetical protein [Escherichia coli]
MDYFDSLIPKMRDQLTENDRLPGNFYFQAREAKRLISLAISANNVNAERAAAAAFGGVVKRWRGWLIEQLTETSLAGRDTSRDSVRGWQQRIFGRSVASGRLRKYARPERSGAGRAVPLDVPAEVERLAADFYQQHKDAIKLV